ncbi:hypothetical protein D3C79_785000 [compost metagenome]
MLLDAVGHHLDRFDAGTLQVLHTVLANVAGKAFNLVTNATDQLAAVTPAGAPANASSLQQYDREPALGQFDRRVDASKTAADNTHISAQFACQGRVFWHRAYRCLVVGAGMLRSRIHRGSLVHLFDFTLLQERVITRMICGVGVLET